MSLKIVPILCNAGIMDNYSYLLTDTETKVSAIVDAAEETPIVDYCSAHNLVPEYILTTHHHKDHTNANLALKKRYNLKIAGSEIEKEIIDGLDIALNDGDTFNLGNIQAKVILTAGHTLGHILWYFPTEKVLFTGDMLFNMTIGGLFEGTPQQMWQSIQKIKMLPDDVKFYSGHEYSRASLNYLKTLASDNPYAAEYLAFLQNTNPPVGNSLGLEKKCNPYFTMSSENDFIRQMS